MKSNNHLSNEMRQFLRKVRDETATLAELTGRAFIPQAVLQRWLRNRYFRRTFAGVMRGLRREGELSMSLGARSAERMILEMLAGQRKCERMEMMLCYAIVDLSYRRDEARLRRRRRRGPGASSGRVPRFDARPRPHRSHTKQRAHQLLTELRALQQRELPVLAQIVPAQDPRA